MINAKLYMRMWLSIAKKIREGIGSIQFQEFGVRTSADETVEEWIALFPISVVPILSTNPIKRAEVLFQVSSFSRFPQSTTDIATRTIVRPFEMADLVRELLDKDVISIQDLDQVTPVEIVCMQVQELNLQYLPERAPGRRGEATVGRIAANVHGVAQTFRGFLVQGD